MIPYEHKEWKQPLPEKGEGFVDALPNGITILTIRPVPGDITGAYMLRVQNGTGQATEATIPFPTTRIEEAYLGSVLGAQTGQANWSAHEVKLPLAPFDVKTLVVRIGSSPK